MNVGTSDAAITGVTLLSNSATFTFAEGVVTYSTIGPAAISPYAAFTASGYVASPDGTAGFGGMDISYLVDQGSNRARVIIPNTGLVAIASQPGPAPGDFAISSRVDFSISFDIDAAGNPATTIPIAYPIAFGQTAAGMSNTFDAEIDYTSAADGYLGTSEVHFSFAAGPGGSAYYVVSGADLALPAIDPLDTLTLSGYFLLKADGLPGHSTEIEVFGIPEPSAAFQFLTGLLGIALVRAHRRQY